MYTFNKTSEYLDLLEQYKLLAENTVECIWLFDLKNRCFKYISPSILNLRGSTVEEAMKEKLEDCLTPESMKKIKDQGLTRLPQFLAGNRSENIASSIDEFDQYCKDGSIKPIEISTKLILNNETGSVDVLGVSRDICNRKSNSHNIRNLFGIDNGRIYCFGKLLVYGKSSNTSVKWRTSKSEELFAYLIQNLELEVPKWKICEALWPDCDSNKINNYLHTSLYKMKQTLKSANIKFEIKFTNNCYWMSLPDVYIDIKEFNSAIHSNINITDSTIEKYEKLFLLYKDNYFEGNDYQWSIARKETYSLNYFKLAESIIKYYMKTYKYIDAGRIVRIILEKFPLNNFANLMLLRFYYMNNNRKDFINHYMYIQELFKTELGIELDNEIQELYNTYITLNRKCKKLSI